MTPSYREKAKETIKAWVCIDKKEMVNYIHYGKKPQTDTNYDVYFAEIRPCSGVKPKRISSRHRNKATMEKGEK